VYNLYREPIWQDERHTRRVSKENQETLKQRIDEVITIYSMQVYDKKMKLCDALEQIEKEIMKAVKEWLQQKHDRVEVIPKYYYARQILKETDR